MKQRLIKASAYGLGYLLMTLIFVYMTFPTEAARDVLERTARYKAGVWTEIGGLSLDGLSGVTLEDVYIQLNPKAPLGEDLLTKKERKKEHRQISLNIDNLSVEADLLGMAGHTPADPLRYALTAELFGGTLSLEEHYIPEARSKNAQEIKGLELSDIDLRKTRLLRSLLPVDLEGILQVKADLKHRPNGPPESGNLTIILEKALLKSFVLPIEDPNMIAMGITKLRPTDASLGTIQIEAKFEEPKRGRRAKRRGASRGNTMLRFKRFEVTGGDIEVMQDGEGLIQWTSESAPLKSGRINLQLGIKLNDGFINKEIKEKGSTDKPNLMLGMVRNVREVKQAMRGDWIGIHITGTLANPTIRKRRPSARIQRPVQSAPPAKPEAKRRPRKPRATPAPRPSTRPVRSPDNQRGARQERLKKRREELKKRREERARERDNKSNEPKPSLRDRNRGPRGVNGPLGGSRYDAVKQPPSSRQPSEPDEQEEEIEEEEERTPEDYVEEEEGDEEEVDEDSDDNEELNEGDEESEDDQTFDEEEEID